MVVSDILWFGEVKLLSKIHHKQSYLTRLIIIVDSINTYSGEGLFEPLNGLHRKNCTVWSG